VGGRGLTGSASFNSFRVLGGGGLWLGPWQWLWEGMVRGWVYFVGLFILLIAGKGAGDHEWYVFAWQVCLVYVHRGLSVQPFFYWLLSSGFPVHYLCL